MAAPEPRTVLVRGLPPGATAALLERLFGHLGPLRRCFVVTEKGSPKCRGFGYVTFSLPEDAARALREPPELGGRRLGVTPARPRPRPEGKGKGEPPPGPPRPKKPRGPSRKARLILRNLSFQCSEDELRGLFAPFGPVLELNLPRKPDGTPRGFAFVQLRNLREAAAALGGLNGAQLRGRPLAVDWAVAKDKYQETQGPPKTPEGEGREKEKGEEKQEEEEEREEEEEDEEEEKEEEDEEEEEEEEDKEEEDERRKKRRKKLLSLPGGPQKCGQGSELGWGVERRRRKRRRRRKMKMKKRGEDEDEEEDEEDGEEEPTRKRRQRPSDVAEGRTVFIRNLSFDTEEEELEETLQRFGGVCYVRLVLHPHTGTPKGSAFAQFETPEGAQKCIEAAQEGPEGGGLRVGGRLLRVDPALSRDQARGLQGHLGGPGPRTGTRNLYLAREGAIRPGSRAAEGVSDSDMAKRARFEELKRRRLQDPNVGVSRTRLCLHNLPKALDSPRLRALLRGLLRAPGATAPLIKECRVMRELRGQGQSLGFAFVEFGEHEEALGALRRLNNNPELFGAHKRPIVEFALEDRRKLRLREQRIQRGLLKAKAKAKVAAGPPDPPQAPPDPPQGRPDPPAGSGGTQDPPRPPPGTPPGAPWAGFRTQGPGQGGAPGAPRPKVLALPSHRGPKIRKRDKGKAQPPPKPPKAPKASRRREKLRVPPPQSQRRRRGGPGGAEARFQELVERYKRKILGSDAPTARGGKWFES
ncbi:LOW QUALITY PROTEIN: RNA-binding protein 28 [Cyanocitta cristata]